jgi:hypothetical protein
MSTPMSDQEAENAFLVATWERCRNYMAYLGARPPDVVWDQALGRFRDLRIRHKQRHGPDSTFDTEPPASRRE